MTLQPHEDPWNLTNDMDEDEREAALGSDVVAALQRHLEWQ